MGVVARRRNSRHSAHRQQPQPMARWTPAALRDDHPPEGQEEQMRCETCGRHGAEAVDLYRDPTQPPLDEPDRATLCQECQFLKLELDGYAQVRPRSRTGEDP